MQQNKIKNEGKAIDRMKSIRIDLKRLEASSLAPSGVSWFQSNGYLRWQHVFVWWL